MLAIKNITLAAAFAAAPVTLWGCSSKNPSSQVGRDPATWSPDDGTDKNGTPPDALASEKAIRGVIGDTLYKNYMGTEKSRDKATITRSWEAVKNAVIKEIGAEAATNALKTWKNGDPVPDVVVKYVDQLKNGKLATQGDKWTDDCNNAVVNIRKSAAIAAIKKAIGDTIKSNDSGKIDEVFDGTAKLLTDKIGEQAVCDALTGWKVGEKIPDVVVECLKAYLAMHDSM